MHRLEEVVVRVEPVGRVPQRPRAQAVLEQRRALCGEDRAAEVSELCTNLERHPVADLAQKLRAPADDLLDRERRQVDVETDVEHEHVALHLGARHLQTGQRVEEDLALSRVLREPRDVGAPVDHPHPHREEAPRAAATRCVRVRHLLVRRRRHKGVLAPTAQPKLVGRPELVGKHSAGDAPPNALGLGELRQLDDGRIDHVQRRRVQVASKELFDLLRVPARLTAPPLDATEPTQHLVVTHVQRARVEARAGELLEQHRRTAERLQLPVDLHSLEVEVAQRALHTPPLGCEPKLDGVRVDAEAALALVGVDDKPVLLL